MQSMASIEIKKTHQDKLIKLASKYDVTIDDLLDIAFDGLFDGAEHGLMEELFDINSQAAG